MKTTFCPREKLGRYIIRESEPESKGYYTRVVGRTKDALRYEGKDECSNRVDEWVIRNIESIKRKHQ